MEITFVGKRALVTGAGQGIGFEVVKALVAAGAETFGLSRSQENLNKLKKEVPAVCTVCVDLADWSATREAVEKLGAIDLLVNNAGVSSVAKVLDVTQQQFDSIMDVNVKAVINVTQVVAKTMVSRASGGSIVNISSQASQAALSNHLVYGASKAALDGLTRNFALELGPHNIRVNSINPTVVMTEMSRIYWNEPEKKAEMLSKIPMARFAEVKDVVHPVLFLLSDKADMINGISLPVDGGFLAC